MRTREDLVLAQARAGIGRWKIRTALRLGRAFVRTLSQSDAAAKNIVVTGRATAQKIVIPITSPVSIKIAFIIVYYIGID